jgi:hypothetical protein
MNGSCPRARKKIADIAACLPEFTDDWLSKRLVWWN